MKQNRWALSWRAFVFSIIHASFTFTLGFSITSANFPFPSSDSVMIPVAESVYSKTTTEVSEQKCRNQSIWQEESEATNISSGLYFDLSPRNDGSELPSIGGFPSTEIIWDLSYPR